jgi:hypothetical protein
MLKPPARSLLLALLGTTLLAVIFPRRPTAQTRADSVAFARLVVARAFQDARRQSSIVHNLTVVPTGERRRLLELISDSLLTRQSNAPPCPWRRGFGTGFAVDARIFEFGQDDAKLEVFLRCGRGAFEWAFRYRLRRVQNTWVIDNVREKWIS